MGSYGSVCRAMLDQLPCAAKLLHATFFGTHDPGQVNFAALFEQECAFLSNLRYPCIVQFLGLVREPQNLRPIFLMELMDESLTKFLERTCCRSTGLPRSGRPGPRHCAGPGLSPLQSHRPQRPVQQQCSPAVRLPSQNNRLWYFPHCGCQPSHGPSLPVLLYVSFHGPGSPPSQPNLLRQARCVLHWSYHYPNHDTQIPDSERVNEEVGLSCFSNWCYPGSCT